MSPDKKIQSLLKILNSETLRTLLLLLNQKNEKVVAKEVKTFMAKHIKLH